MRACGSRDGCCATSSTTGAAGEQVDKRTIATGNPIKALGNHEVTVRLHEDVSATVALNVIPA